MVGFGSSLRLARRPGWEGSYLDYEALKLLLSHIEAIYEEGIHHHPPPPPTTTTTGGSSSRNHRLHHHTTLTTNEHHHSTALGSSWEVEDEVYMNHRSSRIKSHRKHHRRRRRSKYDRQQPNDFYNRGNNYTTNSNIDDVTTVEDQNVIRDYKVDLFLESDSDRAYISVDDPYDDDEDDVTTDDDDDDDEFTMHHHNDHHHHLDGTIEETGTIKPFVVISTSSTYAQIPHDDRSFDVTGGGGPYDDYDSEDNLMIRPTKYSGNSCWGGSNTNSNNNHMLSKSTTTTTTTATTLTTGSTTKRKSKSRHHHPRSHRKGGSSGSSQLLLPGGGLGSIQSQQPPLSQPLPTEEDLRSRPYQYHDIASSSTQQHQQPMTPPWKATSYPYYGDTTTSDANSYHYQDELHYFIRPAVATTSNNSVANTESTALLQPPLFSTPGNNKNGSMSPPHRSFFWNQTSTEPTANTGSIGPLPNMPIISGVNSAVKNGTTAIDAPIKSFKKKPKVTAQEIRRKKERRRRRREQIQRLRQEREKKVPRHIRIAHTKARAITERFLGLLRAETEKVLLFAQSRLGELADTAGSLRFPSYDEEYASNHPSLTGNPRRDYEFGDGGMHPSASSSSDDQYNGGGGNYGRPPQQPSNQQQWFSDSSDDENEDQSNHLATTINSLLNNNINSTVGMAKADTTSISAKIGTTATTFRSKEADHLRYIQRQIAHFTELRKRRAIFQRNEQILGEDMLFLSAVEEVDGYTAVGVELLHTLKYICINLIAVRKICRKHDRLLMNRMLGGYYHRLRKRKSNIAGVQTLGGMVTQISGDIYEAHPSVLGQRNHFKLVGVYDHRIQNLANSRTVQVVSSCLALSLSEYEVARSRADALTRMNSVTSLDSGSLRHGRNNTGSDDTDVESLHDDVPSTTSNISLTRLRYTIMSIFALREVSRTKRDYFMTYLSRVSLAFTGQPVIGEGLDGCSRETLDFLVSYNPDTALLSDVMLLYEGLKQNRWSYLPLGDVMIASLATATIQSDLTLEVKLNMLHREEANVAYAVSANPDSNIDFWKAIFNGQSHKVSALASRTVVIRQLPPIVLRLSRTSLFLYSVSSVLLFYSCNSCLDKLIDFNYSFS